MNKIKAKIISILDTIKQLLIPLALNYYRSQAIIDYYVYNHTLAEVVDYIYGEFTEEKVNEVTAFLQYYPENKIDVDPSYKARVKGMISIVVLTLVFPSVTLEPFKIDT